MYKPAVEIFLAVMYKQNKAFNIELSDVEKQDFVETIE